MTSFFHMGGYGFYVWGSYGVALLLMVIFAIRLTGVVGSSTDPTITPVTITATWTPRLPPAGLGEAGFGVGAQSEGLALGVEAVVHAPELGAARLDQEVHPFFVGQFAGLLAGFCRSDGDIGKRHGVPRFERLAVFEHVYRQCSRIPSSIPSNVSVFHETTLDPIGQPGNKKPRSGGVFWTNVGHDR